ncbi:putative reverse transcriptase domain-containing protein [Tanacetum coccineum]
MSWRELMKLMAEVYCPRNEIQKMESELWNLTVKNNDLAAYTQRFQELTMMCTKMVPEEEDRVEKFIGGLPDKIQGNVIAAEPTRLQDAVRIANILMDQKLKGYAVKNVENKRRLEVNQRDNRGHQPSFKRPNVGGLLGHPFNIDLMPVELGSFDVIIGMDWLANHHVVIMCDEKIVWIPYGDEVLIIQGYKKQITKKETEDKSEEKGLEDVPIIRDFSENEEEHAEHLKLILELLKKEEFYAKFSKCGFWLSKVQFLAHVINNEGIHMDPAKIEPIKDWALPKTQIEIHQFLDTAFQLLKQKLCSVLILDLPDDSKNFVVYCDASCKGLGANLMEREKVIAYASCQLKIHEKNYTTHDLELGAVVFALKM